jgi:hypothetical protein
MRCISLVTLVLFLAPVYAEENEAEKLYRAMENKIRSVKSLHVVFEGEGTADGKKGKVKGTFDFEGNKFRIVQEVTVDGKTEKSLTVSDGKLTFSNFTGKAETFRRAPQDGDFEKALALLARGGPQTFFNVCSFGPPKKDDFNLDKFLKVKDIKLGPKEKIGKHDTQVLEYLAFFGKDKEAVKLSVWINPKTNLPVKLASVAKKEGKEVGRGVDFITMTVNDKTDAKLFELPK